MRIKLTTKSIEATKIKNKVYDVHDSELNKFVLRINPTGVKTYYFNYYNQDNKRKWFRIGSTNDLSPAQARDIAKQLAGDVARGLDPQADKNHKREEAKQRELKLFRTFLDQQYGPWVIANRKTGTDTLRRINTHFSDLLDKELDSISTWTLEKWRSSRLKSGISPSTVNRDLACLKAALQKAVEWNLIDTHPLAKLKPSKVDKSPNTRYLSEQEEMRLKQALKKRDQLLKDKRESGNQWRKVRGHNLYPIYKKTEYSDYLEPILILALNTGLRKGELLSLKWSDINLNTKQVTVQGANAKSSNTRHIPLNTDALEMLRKWKKQDQYDNYVFYNGNGLKLDDFKKSYKSLLKLANITSFRIHDLRHHFASKLVMNNVPLNTVRELLGHADISTTLRYAHLAPDHKAEAVEKLV